MYYWTNRPYDDFGGPLHFKAAVVYILAVFKRYCTNALNNGYSRFSLAKTGLFKFFDFFRSQRVPQDEIFSMSPISLKNRHT